MKTMTVLLASVCVAAAGLSAVAQNDTSREVRKEVRETSREVQRNTSDAVKDAQQTIKSDAGDKLAFPAGISARTTDKDAKGLFDPLAEITDAAFSKDGFNNLVGRLVDQDRDRINQLKDRKDDELNAVVDRVRTAFKNKYGRDINAEVNIHLEGFAKAITGEVQDPNALVGKWPVSSGLGAGLGSDLKNEAGKLTPEDAKKTEDKLFGGNVNLEKGRNVGLVQIPASHGKAALTVSLIQESPTWRIDIPNNISGQQLHRNLVNALTEFEKDQEKWPTDSIEATRMAVHCVASALYKADMTNAPMVNEKERPLTDMPR